MNTKINIGDEIKIVDWGYLYTTYEEAAKKMMLKNWISEHKGSTKNRFLNKYIVVGRIQNSSRENVTVLGVTNGTEDFVIGSEGVELIPKSIISEETKLPQLFDANNLYPYED
jgi:hypothetical protein